MKRGLIAVLVAIASLAATAVPASAAATLTISESCLTVVDGQLQPFTAYVTGATEPDQDVIVTVEPGSGPSLEELYANSVHIRPDSNGAATISVESGGSPVPPEATSVWVKLYQTVITSTGVTRLFTEIQVPICARSTPADTDNDGVPDTTDNCLNTSNASQADVDNDGIGDACDPQNDTDTDNDGVRDAIDNCPTVQNPGQADADNDGIGDACDPTPKPVPTSKEQCKRADWETYGIFKNQGDCVSFVASKGMNPPAGAR